VTTFDLDDSKSRFLVLETGYRYITAPDANPETRLIEAATSNFPLQGGFFLSDRNRFDLDWKNDLFSWRYQNKLTLACEHDNNTGKRPSQQVNSVGLVLNFYFSLEEQ